MKRFELQSKVGSFMKDDNFSTKSGLVNLQHSKELHWVCFIGKFYCDCYGCPLP